MKWDVQLSHLYIFACPKNTPSELPWYGVSVKTHTVPLFLCFKIYISIFELQKSEYILDFFKFYLNCSYCISSEQGQCGPHRQLSCLLKVSNKKAQHSFVLYQRGPTPSDVWFNNAWLDQPISRTQNNYQILRHNSANQATHKIYIEGLVNTMA